MLNFDGRLFAWETWLNIASDPQPVSTSAVSPNFAVDSVSLGRTTDAHTDTFGHLFAVTTDGLPYDMNHPYRKLDLVVQPLNAQGKAVGVQAVSATTVLGDDGLLDVRVPETDDRIYCGEIDSPPFKAAPVGSNERVIFTYLGDSVYERTPCALVQDGRVFCWHDDSSRFESVDLSGLKAGDSARQLSSSGSTHCLLTHGGEVYCWVHGGMPTHNDGSDGLFQNEKVPFRRLDLRHVTSSKNGVFVAAPGPGVGLILTEDGRGYSWGRSIAIGNLQYCTPHTSANACTAAITHPVPIQTAHPPAGLKWKELATSQNSVCGLTQDNNVYCWGAPEHDQQSGDFRYEPALLKRIW